MKNKQWRLFLNSSILINACLVKCYLHLAGIVLFLFRDTMKRSSKSFKLQQRERQAVWQSVLLRKKSNQVCLIDSRIHFHWLVLDIFTVGSHKGRDSATQSLCLNVESACLILGWLKSTPIILALIRNQECTRPASSVIRYDSIMTFKQKLGPKRGCILFNI